MRFFSKIFFATFWPFLAFGNTAQGKFLLGQEGHGDVTFQIGNAVRVFDALEYQDVFLPAEQAEYLKIIRPQLAVLTKKLPRLGNTLEKIFERGILPRWFFVNYSLRSVGDEGGTHLVLTYAREQIALNDNGIIQIQKRLWSKLARFDRAILLVHEAIWSSVGEGNIRPNSGRAVRKLASLILDPNLEHFTNDEIASEVQLRAKEICETPDVCPLYQLGRPPSDLYPAQGWLDVSTLSDDSMPTTCQESQHHCAYSDLKTHLYWSSIRAGGARPVTWEKARTACASLQNWAGIEDWRLPSAAEVMEAATNGLYAVLRNDLLWESPYSILWTASIDPLRNGYAKLFDLGNNSFLSYRKSGASSFICVAGDYSKNWKDISRDPSGATQTTCERNSDQCVFWDHSTKLAWSEVSPHYAEEESAKSTYQYDWVSATRSCSTLGSWGGGHANWRLPTARELEVAALHGLPRVAIANADGYGRLDGSFWSGEWGGPTRDLSQTLQDFSILKGYLSFFDFSELKAGQEAYSVFVSTAEYDGGTNVFSQATLSTILPITTLRGWVCVRPSEP